MHSRQQNKYTLQQVSRTLECIYVKDQVTEGEAFILGQIVGNISKLLTSWKINSDKIKAKNTHNS